VVGQEDAWQVGTVMKVPNCGGQHMNPAGQLSGPSHPTGTSCEKTTGQEGLSVLAQLEPNVWALVDRQHDWLGVEHVSKPHWTTPVRSPPSGHVTEPESVRLVAGPWRSNVEGLVKHMASCQPQRREIETAPVDRVTENTTFVSRPSSWRLRSGHGP
jgi:hypothetical protein